MSLEGLVSPSDVFLSIGIIGFVDEGDSCIGFFTTGIVVWPFIVCARCCRLAAR
jgi:hypothetical protein